MVSRDSVMSVKQNPQTTTTMNIDDIKSAFMQGNEDHARKMLDATLRGCVRAGLWEAMQAEVEALCGPRYAPREDAACHRAGSEAGVFYGPEGKEPMRRPRVRDANGEVSLDIYELASNQQTMFDQVVTLVAEGMGLRGLGRAMEGTVSKSAAGRMWEQKSREQLSVLRGASLAETQWLALVIDGVWLTKDICVVVGLGIDVEGNKKMLDFEVGSSESLETVDRLLGRLVERKFGPMAGHKLLVLRDGSAAIAGAVSRRWPDAVQQECLVHAERNVSDRMGKRHRSEIQRLFEQLRNAQGKADSEAAFKALVDYCAERNAAAALALKDREAVLLAFQRLEVPSTLNLTFLNTNMIENVFRNWRQHTHQIKRWQVKGDMVERWVASGLLWAQAGFNRIRHAEDLGALVLRLACCAPDLLVADAPSKSSAPQAKRKTA
jgi:transposase-like protein